MGRKEKIQQDIQEAQKASETLRLSTLRLLMSALANKQIEKRTKLAKDKSKDIKTLKQESELTDEEMVGVINAEIKKRKESIEIFEKGNRTDLVDKEKKELQILQNYAPAQLSDEELRTVVAAAIKQVGATSVAELGKVMKQVMQQVAGRVEGARVAELIKEQLK